jgi:hypothetical protein
MIYIFYRSWVDTRWQQYITHLHTNSTHYTEIGKLGNAGRAPSCELWMELAQDRDRWRPLVSTVKNLRVP